MRYLQGFSTSCRARQPTSEWGGTRMMWYADKAAFRVGNVLSTKWNKNNVGTYSIAMGYETSATAESSMAIGRFSTASGFGSTVIGSSSTASGDTSFATGSGNVASGEGSTSLGVSTTASGIVSTAMGSSTVASGIISTSMGYSTTASGLYATATGSETTASGSSSFATGIMTTASGNGSMAVGELTKASGNRSIAMGVETTASSFGSLAMGRYNDSIVTSSKTSWVATDPVFIIGNGDSDANRKNAMTVYKNGTLQLQNLTSTPANNSDKFYVLNNMPFYGDKILTGQLEYITEGSNSGWRLFGVNPINYGNIGDGALDLSLSYSTSSTRGATGTSATAIGNNTTASGVFATAIGQGTRALGHLSIAMGNGTTASEDNAMAMGTSTRATGKYSTSMGFGTIAKAHSSLSIGVYNNPIETSDSLDWVSTDPIFIIGNGDFITRSNAITILKNAKTGINTAAPLAGLHIKGVEATSDAHIRLENNANADYGNIFYDGNMKFRNFGADDQYQWFNSTNATTMSLNNNGELNLLGKLSAPNIQMTTGASNGRVLQSDASGNGSWVNVNTLATNNLYNSNGSLTSARTITQGSNALTISNNGTQNTIINLSSTGDFDIQDNGTSALKVQDDGKVGINQSTPLAGLHIKGVEATFDAHIRLETAGAGTEYGNILYDGNMKFRNFGASDEYQWRNSANNIRMRLMDSGDFAVTGNANVGGLTLNAGSVSVTSNDQIVNVGSGSYLKLSSNSTTATDRTIILSDGLTAGQILMIESTSTGANVFEILDGAGSNTNTTGTITMTSGDMIQLLWNGSDWLQVSYANN
ncbi:MAG: hypothetical protein IPL63_10215 [Saprospiraceae bacterium]|nr:hypothetical protein [Saprospiraceae bacterium]